jgi:hypothetical protein
MKSKTSPVAARILIHPSEVPAIYGFSYRQIRRWIAEGRLRRVKPSGPSGPVYLRVSDLDDLIEESTIPAGQKAGRKPRGK